MQWGGESVLGITKEQGRGDDATNTHNGNGVLLRVRMPVVHPKSWLPARTQRTVHPLVFFHQVFFGFCCMVFGGIITENSVFFRMPSLPFGYSCIGGWPPPGIAVAAMREHPGGPGGMG